MDPKDHLPYWRHVYDTHWKEANGNQPFEVWAWEKGWLPTPAPMSQTQWFFHVVRKIQEVDPSFDPTPFLFQPSKKP